MDNRGAALTLPSSLNLATWAALGRSMPCGGGGIAPSGARLNSWASALTLTSRSSSWTAVRGEPLKAVGSASGRPSVDGGTFGGSGNGADEPDVDESRCSAASTLNETGL